MAANLFLKTLPKKVLLAVDGSEHSLAATQLVSELTVPEESHILVISVLASRRVQGGTKIPMALEEAEGFLSRHHCKVESELLTGSPAEQIIQRAETYQPDLIVMGARGLRATFGILLGGVAQQVVEYAHWPVLVVRAPYTGLQQIILVTDGSIYSDQAVEFLSAWDLGYSNLSVIHVLPPVQIPEAIPPVWALDLQAGAAVSGYEIEQSFQKQVEREEEHGQDILSRTLHKLDQHGHAAKSVLLRGDAASEIIAYATEHNSDLIVAGSRGLGQVRGWLLGSVSRKLLHYAKSSVLIVRNGEVE